MGKECTFSETSFQMQNHSWCHSHDEFYGPPCFDHWPETAFHFHIDRKDDLLSFKPQLARPAFVANRGRR